MFHQKQGGEGCRQKFSVNTYGTAQELLSPLGVTEADGQWEWVELCRGSWRGSNAGQSRAGQGEAWLQGEAAGSLQIRGKGHREGRDIVLLQQEQAVDGLF